MGDMVHMIANYIDVNGDIIITPIQRQIAVDGRSYQDEFDMLSLYHWGFLFPTNKKSFLARKRHYPRVWIVIDAASEYIFNIRCGDRIVHFYPPR